MEKTLRKFTSHEEMRAETYRYWHGRPNAEIFETVWEMSRDAYRAWDKLKGIEPHGEGSARTLTRIQRTIR
jgi:hypothetical protein